MSHGVVVASGFWGRDETQWLAKHWRANRAAYWIIWRLFMLSGLILLLIGGLPHDSQEQDFPFVAAGVLAIAMGTLMLCIVTICSLAESMNRKLAALENRLDEFLGADDDAMGRSE